MKTRTGFVLAIIVAMVSISGAAPVPKGAEEKGKDDPAKARAEAMKRWNVAAKGVNVAGPGGIAVGFDWTDADKFPHPTYKGGSAEAYGAFAGILLSFLQNKENFDYLAKHKLFDAELRYTFPNGKATTWTFTQLAEQLAAPNATGNHDEATRKALKTLAEKMKPAKE